METFQGILTELILPHWPFFAWLVCAMMIGQVMKSAVWTKERAYAKGKMQSVYWWGYKTLAIHPVMSGAVLGCIWREPEEGMTKLPACIAYFALAGACSVFAFEMLSPATCMPSRAAFMARRPRSKYPKKMFMPAP